MPLHNAHRGPICWIALENYGIPGDHYLPLPPYLRDCSEALGIRVGRIDVQPHRDRFSSLDHAKLETMRQRHIGLMHRDAIDSLLKTRTSMR